MTYSASPRPVRRTLAAFLAAAAVTGCTWVDLSEEGATVALLEEMPAACERLGSTTSTTQSQIARIDRSDGKVSDELTTLARNAAARMGGDTIVPITEISEAGEQTFAIFRCEP